MQTFKNCPTDKNTAEEKSSELFFNKNYYEILGVANTASLQAIRTAYHNLLKIHHPDRNIHLSSELKNQKQNISKKLTEIYETLSDPRKRELYDAEIKKSNVPSTGIFASKPKSTHDEKMVMSESDYIHALERNFKYKSYSTGSLDPIVSVASVIPSKRLINAIAKQRPIEEIKQIISSNPSIVNETDSNGNNGIHIAIALNRKSYGLEVIELLVKNSCDVCHKNQQGQSPLYFLIHANQSYNYFHNFGEAFLILGIVKADMIKYLDEYSKDDSFKRFMR